MNTSILDKFTINGEQITLCYILPGIYHLKFKTQATLTRTFIRLSEFFESAIPDITGKYFTVNKVHKAYKSKYNQDYYATWSGFNIYKEQFEKFFKLFGRKLTSKERKLKLIYKFVNKHANGKKFCLIATFKQDTLTHEIAHALFYVNREYKQRVLTTIKRLSYYDNFIKNLIAGGYGRQVCDDEMQAYLAADSKQYLINRFEFKKNWRMSQHLKNTFKRFLADRAN